MACSDYARSEWTQVTLGSLAGNGGVNMQATGSLVTGNATNTTYSGILSGGTAGTTR